MLVAELLSQGDEVVTGQIADTNAAWLAARLTALGFQVRRHTTVGDHLADLVGLLTEVAGRADLCISTGGLGPTDDDLTAEAAAALISAPLELDPIALQTIEARYAEAGRVMPPVNRKQALLPAGSTRLDNDWGTAPGFALEHQGTTFAFLPGVPGEMRRIFDERVLPLLRPRFTLQPSRLVTLRTCGLGESNLQQRIGAFSHPDAVLGFRTHLPGNHVKIRFAPSVEPPEILRVVQELAARIGASLFTIEGLPELESPSLAAVDRQGGDLAQVVGRALADRGETLATAESCTGGLLAAQLTAVPGASAWFLEGSIPYANAAKLRHLSVQPSTLAAHGAVSEAVARELAEGARTLAGSTYALSTTGVAGPGGGTPDKPVGTVHIALATPGSTIHRLLRLPGDRQRVQILAAATGLDLLRRHLYHSLR